MTRCSQGRARRGRRLGFLYFRMAHFVGYKAKWRRTRIAAFVVFSEFRNASYADRYTIFIFREKLLRERLCYSACLLFSDQEGGLRGNYIEPSEEVGFRNFAASLMGHAIAYAKLPDR